MAIDTIKMACQDVIDRVEDIVPKDTQGAFDISLTVNIPTLTDDILDLPNFTISMKSYPARDKISKLLGLGRNEGAP